MQYDMDVSAAVGRVVSVFMLYLSVPAPRKSYSDFVKSWHSWILGFVNVLL